MAERCSASIWSMISEMMATFALWTCCPHAAIAAGNEPPASFEIDYSPTAELISKPLDPIGQPWLKAKRCEITAYWQPADVERFASYLSGIPEVWIIAIPTALKNVESKLSSLPN